MLINVVVFCTTEIDECAEGTSQCEHQCTNTNGGFQCSCFDGYSLNTDNHSCTISKSFAKTRLAEKQHKQSLDSNDILFVS